MINLHEFRAGQYSVPFSCGDELPECCFACVYLLSHETDACLCDSRFYFCGYSWPDKLTQTVPPCLLDPRWFHSRRPNLPRPRIRAPVAGSTAPGSGIKV